MPPLALLHLGVGDRMATNLDRLGDYRLRSFAWSETGDDVILTLAAGPLTRTFRFVWATRVTIAIDFREYSGMPLIFSAQADEDSAEGSLHVKVAFQGAPEGSISLTCNDIIEE